MNTKDTYIGADKTEPAISLACATQNVENVPDNSVPFGIIPLNSDRSISQTTDAQLTPKKPHPESLEEKISAEQRSKLLEWLAEHSYGEVQELVAAEPPHGFGFSVGKTTLCRFYKANFDEIDAIRQFRLDGRAFAITQINQNGEYTDNLNNSARQILLERYFQMLSQPLESVDELKKLVAIGEKIHALQAEEKRAARLAQLFNRPQSQPPSDSPAPETT